MKRILSLLAVGAVCFGVAGSSAQAQGFRAFGAGALVLDDSSGHTITAITPRLADSGYVNWITQFPAAGTQLNYKIAIPPKAGEQSGFVDVGPQTGTGLRLLYWDYPSSDSGLLGTTAPSTHTGGPQGAWRVSTDSSLNLVEGSGTLNFVPRWTPTTHSLGNSQIFDDSVHVGIGTTTGTALFNVFGNPLPTPASPLIDFHRSTASGTDVNEIAFGDAAGTGYLAAGSTYIGLATGDGINRFNISNGGPTLGNVNVGTSTGTALFNVYGTPTAPGAAIADFHRSTGGASNTNIIAFGDAAGNGYLTAGSAYVGLASTDGTNRIAIDNGGLTPANLGNVGIGNIDPSYNLDVNGSFRTTSLYGAGPNKYAEQHVIVEPITGNSVTIANTLATPSSVVVVTPVSTSGALVQSVSTSAGTITVTFTAPPSPGDVFNYIMVSQ